MRKLDITPARRQLHRLVRSYRTTTKITLSGLSGGHDVRRHRRVLAVPRAKSFGDCIHRPVESGRIASLDFRAERRAEHQTLGGVASADAARQFDRLTLDVREAGREQIMLDNRRIGIAERA